ncbi:hypothetical protein TBR22_A47880 [Luteitalea sp. TBR-22]|nr:hypothetical protein TBR22_A47880 [Luteitalea sp. TBR-22]
MGCSVKGIGSNGMLNCAAMAVAAVAATTTAPRRRREELRSERTSKRVVPARKPSGIRLAAYMGGDLTAWSRH